jgi:hypothetical protein
MQQHGISALLDFDYLDAKCGFRVQLSQKHQTTIQTDSYWPLCWSLDIDDGRRHTITSGPDMRSDRPLIGSFLGVGDDLVGDRGILNRDFAIGL